MNDNTRQMIPTCQFCPEERITIEHVFLQCPNYDLHRTTLKNELRAENLTMKSILSDHDNIEYVFKFLKDTNLYLSLIHI